MRSCKHEKNAILMNILEWNFIHNALCWSDNSRLWLLLGRPWFNFVTCKILQREKTVRIFKEISTFFCKFSKASRKQVWPVADYKKWSGQLVFDAFILCQGSFNFCLLDIENRDK